MYQRTLYHALCGVRRKFCRKLRRRSRTRLAQRVFFLLSDEDRVYAEDCINGFRPGTGKIDAVTFSPEARVETWIQKGVEVTSLYDPMLAKLIVHGTDRADAIAKMEETENNHHRY